MTHSIVAYAARFSMANCILWRSSKSGITMSKLVTEVLKSFALISFVAATATSPALVWIVGIGFTLEITFNIIEYFYGDTTMLK